MGEGGREGGGCDGEKKESEGGVTIQWSSSKSLVLPVKGGTQVNMCYSQASATVCFRNKDCSGGLGMRLGLYKCSQSPPVRLSLPAVSSPPSSAGGS